ncbi:MAG: hypothetical protein IPN17_08200 [Deltaproteobacteria bacterium]|nr:hypothetical protein [Deltaproteobacteria bacterium]
MATGRSTTAGASVVEASEAVTELLHAALPTEAAKVKRAARERRRRESAEGRGASAEAKAAPQKGHAASSTLT